ncbi:MAG: hypothetical protein ABIA83_01365 [Patescibacteria group bacterium]
MCESTESAVLTCADNGKGRCASHDNGRHALDTNGLCKVGRRLRKELCKCLVCKGQFPAKSGMVFANHREEATAFSALNALIAQVGDNAVCPKCAQESNEDYGRAIFVTLEALRKSVKGFVERFQRGATVMHRHESLGVQMRNWCDHCGRLVALDAEENMGGVIRGNSVICLCPHCNDLAHEAMPDLPTVSFFEGLEQVTGVCVRRPLPKPAPKQVQAAPAQGEEIVDPPATAVVPSTLARKPKFTSVKDVYEALIADDRRVRFGRKDEATGLTHCTVSATASSLCHGDPSDWAKMGSVIQGKMAFGFCPVCTAELTKAGIILPMTHKSAMLQVLGLPEFPERQERPARPANARPRQAWVSPIDAFGFDTGKGASKNTSNARRRQLDASRAERAKEREAAEKVAKKTFQAEVRRLGDETAKRRNELEVVMDLLRQAQASLTAKQVELAEAQSAEETDAEIIGVLELEMAERQRDADEATEMVVEASQSLAQAEREQDAFADAGYEAPVVIPERKNKKDRGRNGGSKAA